MPARFGVLSHLTRVVILLVAWGSMADLGVRTILLLRFLAFQVKVLPKDLEEHIWEVCLLLALQNEV